MYMLVDTQEVQAVRPRGLIESDLTSHRLTFESFDTAMDPLRIKIGQLPSDQRFLLQEFEVKFEAGHVPDSDIQQAFPPNIVPLVLDARGAFDQFKGFLNRQAELEKELIPYKKRDFENALEDVSARIDYDAVFDYYRNHRANRDGSDLLENTFGQLYELRRFQHDQLTPGEDERDFNFYNYRCDTLTSFQKEWERKGFLHDKPRSDFTYSQEFGHSVLAKRMDIAAQFEEPLAQLQEFNVLSSVYQHKLAFSSHFDYELSTVHRLLSDDGKNHSAWGYKNFDQIDYDPEMIDAARRHILKALDEHRKLGHLPPTEQTLAEERKRINQLETRTTNISTEGFTPPEGKVAVVSPSEVLKEVSQLLPPDFVNGLQELTHKPVPPQPTDDPDTETMGSFIPTFDESKRVMTAAKIEVYRKLFVPKGTGELEKSVAKQKFMGTVWHEFGHNAHHVMHYDEMKAWEEVTSRDNIAVSWYVGYARKDDLNRGKREDFSESFKLFISNPALLQILSPPRYHFMLEFFERRTKDDQRDMLLEHLTHQAAITLAVWKENGRTPEQIRDIYLNQ